MSLYKYLVPQRFDILQNAKIRFSQHMALNDPFEMKPYFEGLASDLFLTQFFNSSWETFGEDALKLIDGLIPDVLKDEHYKSTMAQSKYENPGIDLLLSTHKEKMPEVRDLMFRSFNSVGVLCLSKKHDDLIMWAHYANNYKGLAIQFDDKHEFFQQEHPMSKLGGIREVDYSENRPHRASFTDLTTADIFFIKSSDWSYEEEWRMLKPLPVEDSDKVPQDTDGQPVYLFSFPPDCVTGVIFGSRMCEDVRNNFLLFLKTDERYSNVPVYQAKLDEKKFKLNIEQI